MDGAIGNIREMAGVTKPVTAEVVDTLPGSIFRLFLLFARPHLWAVCLMVLMSMLLRGIGVMQVYASKLIVDAAVNLDRSSGAAWAVMAHPLGIFLGLIALAMVCEWIAWTASYNGRIPILARARQLVFNYVQQHTTNYFDNMLTGKVAYRAMLLPEQTVSMFERTNWDYAPVVVLILLQLAVFFSVQPVFALILAGWLLVYGTIAYKMGHGIAKFGAMHSDAKATLTGRIVDSITNIKNVIFFSAHEREQQLVGTSVATTLYAQRKSYIAYVRMRVVLQFMHVLVYALLFSIAINGLIAGQLTPGDFLLISTLTLQLVRTVFDVSNSLPETLDWMGSIRDSIDMLVVPRDIADAKDARPLVIGKGEVRFNKVDFAYEKRENIFNQLDLTIPAGQRVGLIGASGAGKTTMTTLLLRLYDVQAGAVEIDGQDVRKVTQGSLRAVIGLIPQDTVLFHRTLADNIRYGRPDASDAEVEEAAKRACAHEFIMALPHGYKTLVGERGVKLSGGQRQRVAIARAILKNAPILLLDEATSALDSESEAAVQEAMAEAMKGKTVIAIAHRLSTIAHLDRLIVMEEGRIVEEGSHAQLLAKNGVYAQLWHRQSGGFLLMDDVQRTPESA